MKITRTQLAEMIAEEVRSRLRELVEADEDSEKKPKGGDKKRKGASVASADTQDQPNNGEPSGPEAKTGSPSVSTPDNNQDSDPDGPAVDGDGPDPDAEGDADDAIDSDGEGGEDASGAVNNEISGKTIQAITIDPRSKVLPGAKEVVLAFNESTDPLRILVTSTGQVKFFWRGQLHDIP